MSSKVLSGSEEAAAVPFPWRTVSLGPAARGGRTTPAPSAPRPVKAAPPPEDFERRQREAYESGFHDGEAQGTEATRSQVQPVVERLAESIAALAEHRRRILWQAEVDLVRLSLSIAKRILHREVTLDSEAMHGVVKAALERLEHRDLHQIRTHPAIEPALTRALEREGLGGRAQVSADPTLREGDVLLVTSQGVLDASIDTQLREIERGFVDRLEAR